MNPGVSTMSLFADYVKFYAKVKGQGVTLTFDAHVASFTHLVGCKYKSSQATIVSKKKNNNFHFFPWAKTSHQR